MKKETSDFLKFAYENGGIISYEDFCKTPEYKEYALSEEEVEYYMNIYKERCKKEKKSSK